VSEEWTHRRWHLATTNIVQKIKAFNTIKLSQASDNTSKNHAKDTLKDTLKDKLKDTLKDKLKG
jgi:hypothetical protein